jgi:hypothetical protein
MFYNKENKIIELKAQLCRFNKKIANYVKF